VTLAAPLVGRAAELAVLRQWVDELIAGRGRAVLVEGEPGIGKSVLLHDVTTAAAARGCDVFWGSGEALGQAFPLLPLVEAFAVQASAPDPRRAEVARALRDASASSVDAAAERMVDLVDQVCAATPAMLVVDDLQWADPATVALWSRLARSAPQRTLLLVGAMRPAPQRADLSALARDVDAAAALRLGPLPAPSVADLVAGLAGGRPGPQLCRLAEGAAGNPLYVTELVDALLRGGALGVVGGVVEATAAPAPGTLTEAILGRLDFLGEQARHVVEAAALLGDDLSVAELALVLRRDPEELGPSLAEAQADGVLAVSGEHVRFRHALLRQAIYDDLPESARAASHASAARLLYEASAPLDRVARQLLAATAASRPGRPTPFEGWMADWLLDASPMLLRQMAPEAVRLLEVAIGRLKTDDPRRLGLACRLAEGLCTLMRIDEAERLIQRSLDDARDPESFTALHVLLARCREFSGQLATVLTDLETALTRPGLTARQRARLRVRMCRPFLRSEQSEAAEQAARDALSWIAEEGDPETAAVALFVLGAVRARLGEERAAIDLSYQALAAVDGHPDQLDRQLMVRLNLGIDLCSFDRVEEAEDNLRQVERLAERSGNQLRLEEAQAWLACLFFETGRWDDALAESAHVSEDMEAYTRTQVTGALALIALHRGDWAAVRRHVSAGLDATASLLGAVLGWLQQARALELEHSGAPDEAIAILRVGDADVQEVETFLAEAVRLAVVVGDRAAATEFAARAQALPSQADVPRRAATALHCRGLLDRDPQVLLRAADGYGEARRPLSRAQALEAAALVLAESGDVKAARAPFTAAWEGYAALGAAWDIARMRSAFRRFGLRGRWTLRRATTGWAALTAAEVTVAELVAEGRSNPEIAEALAVSRRTVETHVGNALAKLQVRSRVDIARVITDRRQAAGT
jgi:DNA-binding CsgD family transcriptional regulator/tetratricopeptide (TPR) repeat protein